MEYVDYNYYKNSYLKGKEALIDEVDFPFYENQAMYKIKEVTLNKSDSFSNEESVKKATCAIAEVIYNSDKYIQESNKDIPSGIASEKVGEYSVTYKSNVRAEKEREASASINNIIVQYLGVLGLLYRGQ